MASGEGLRVGWAHWVSGQLILGIRGPVRVHHHLPKEVRQRGLDLLLTLGSLHHRHQMSRPPERQHLLEHLDMHQQQIRHGVRPVPVPHLGVADIHLEANVRTAHSKLLLHPSSDHRRRFRAVVGGCVRGEHSLFGTLEDLPETYRR